MIYRSHRRRPTNPHVFHFSECRSFDPWRPVRNRPQHRGMKIFPKRPKRDTEATRPKEDLTRKQLAPAHQATGQNPCKVTSNCNQHLTKQLHDIQNHTTFCQDGPVRTPSQWTCYIFINHPKITKEYSSQWPKTPQKAVNKKHPKCPTNAPRRLCASFAHRRTNVWDGLAYLLAPVGLGSQRLWRCFPFRWPFWKKCSLWEDTSFNVIIFLFGSSDFKVL